MRIKFGGQLEPFSKNGVSRTSGFTIVELLIVIVVIAILAAITVIAFTGMQTRAEEAKLQADLSNAAKLVSADKALSGILPISLSAVDDNKGVKPSEGTNLEYSIDDGDFYITATSTTRQAKSYCYSSKDGGITEGEVCPGHQQPDFGPVSDPVVYLQNGKFNTNQVAGGTGSEVPITINYDIQPNDYVFILFAASYSTAFTAMKDSENTNIASLYAKTMGPSGYNRHYAYGFGNKTGPQTVRVNVCWYITCDYNSNNLKAAYNIYVIRGLGPNPTVASTSTAYGWHDRGVISSPAALPLAKRKLAIFSNLYYGNYYPTLSDASTPGLSWTVDSTAPQTGMGDAIAARHAYATTNTTVKYNSLNTSSTGGANTQGLVMFTFH